jgi:ATP-dependent Clp protease adapter protein ClpS
MEFLRHFVDRILGITRPAPPLILPPNTSLLSLPELVPAGFRRGVEILNDNVTRMDFVVSVLGAHLGLGHVESVRTMLSIHSRGGILIPTSSTLEANKIATGITSAAAAQGYPLVCRAVCNG